MKISDILMEKSVLSSWITDLTYNRPKRILTMTLGNGKKYIVMNISRSMFERWAKSNSKGHFWHSYVKDRYVTTRIV